ncbi:MAG: hypothetical protein OEY98_11860 [Acidimicrobiia bacterium]|nr:hypothetical protein [Acidimicrobiia bacterium]
MKLARVSGTVVSTFNSPIFDEQRLLVCDYLTPTGELAGGYVIAVDVVSAAPGETVLILDEGTGARQIMGVSGGPIRAMVVGIVDDVTSESTDAG